MLSHSLYRGLGIMIYFDKVGVGDVEVAVEIEACRAVMKSLARVAPVEFFQCLQWSDGELFGYVAGDGSDSAPSQNIFQGFVIIGNP